MCPHLAHVPPPIVPAFRSDGIGPQKPLDRVWTPARKGCFKESAAVMRSSTLRLISFRMISLPVADSSCLSVWVLLLVCGHGRTRVRVRMCAKTH